MSGKTSDALTAALAAAIGEIGGLPHDGKNAEHGYRYTSESMIVRHAAPVMARHGLALVPVSIETIAYREGRPANRAERVPAVPAELLVRYEYELRHVSGAAIRVQTIAFGRDWSDKVAAKVATAARKQVLTDVLLIARGVDEDPDAESITVGDAPARDDEPPTRKAPTRKAPTRKQTAKERARDRAQKRAAVAGAMAPEVVRDGERWAIAEPLGVMSVLPDGRRVLACNPRASSRELAGKPWGEIPDAMLRGLTDFWTARATSNPDDAIAAAAALGARLEVERREAAKANDADAGGGEKKEREAVDIAGDDLGF